MTSQSRRSCRRARGESSADLGSWTPYPIERRHDAALAKAHHSDDRFADVPGAGLPSSRSASPGTARDQEVRTKAAPIGPEIPTAPSVATEATATRRSARALVSHELRCPHPAASSTSRATSGSSQSRPSDRGSPSAPSVARWSKSLGGTRRHDAPARVPDMDDFDRPGRPPRRFSAWSSCSPPST
jgi:hypothetical protein